MQRAVSPQRFPRHPHEIAQPERLRDPAAAALFEKAFGFGAGDVAGHEDQPARDVRHARRDFAEERLPSTFGIFRSQMITS